MAARALVRSGAVIKKEKKREHFSHVAVQDSDAAEMRGMTKDDKGE